MLPIYREEALKSFVQSSPCAIPFIPRNSSARSAVLENCSALPEILRIVHKTCGFLAMEGAGQCKLGAVKGQTPSSEAKPSSELWLLGAGSVLWHKGLNTISV